MQTILYLFIHNSGKRRAMVKVVGISGSPRKGGNSDILLDKALEGAREAGAEVLKIRLNDLSMKGCQECGACQKTGKCVLDDDMQKLYRLLEELDVLIIASPVFFSGLSSQTKMMIDRCQSLWARKYRLNNPIATDGRRRGAFLSVGGMKRSDFSGAISTIKVFFTSIDIKYMGELTFPGIDYKGQINDHPSALGEAHIFGKKLVLSDK
jgi:multimeric flavodoxin WrbA